jgi:hypothetical protein
MTGRHQAKLGTWITAEGQEYLEKDFQTRIARVHRKRRRFASATGRRVEDGRQPETLGQRRGYIFPRLRRFMRFTPAGDPLARVSPRLPWDLEDRRSKLD